MRIALSIAALVAAAVVGLLALPPARPAPSIEVAVTRPPPPPAPSSGADLLAVGPEAALPAGAAPGPPSRGPALVVTRVGPPPAPPAQPAWRRYAVAPGPDDGRPMIAIVIDDMGLDRRHSAEILDLPAPLTISFMTYAEDLATQAATARRHGHELMLHLPMEPLAARFDPGPNALRVELDETELRRRLDWDLGRLGGVVGANNHMGSRFTEWPEGMALVADALNQRGLFFLDSRTSPRSVGDAVARERGVPHVARDVFLDDVATVPMILGQLAETEAVARRKGAAVAIGHPYEATVEALGQWLRAAAASGYRLVPLSAVVAHNEGLQGHATADEGTAPLSARDSLRPPGNRPQ